MPKTQPLCISAELSLRGRVWAKARKSSFIVLPGKGYAASSCPWKVKCPNLWGFGEEFCSSGSRMGLLIRFGCVQGLHSFNLVSDNLLMSLSDFINLASGGLLWNEEYKSFCQRFSFCKQLKDIVLCITWDRIRTLSQSYIIVSWLFLPSLCIPLPSLISNCLNLCFGTQGRSWRLRPIPYKQETGDTDRPPCPEAPQGPVDFRIRLTPPLCEFASIRFCEMKCDFCLIILLC